MSTLTQFAGAGLKSVQTGYVDTSTLTIGTGEDVRHLNVTIAAVQNPSKCVVRFVGGHNSGSAAVGGGTMKAGSLTVFEATPRLTSATNLRLSSTSGDAGRMSGRWYVEEYY